MELGIEAKTEISKGIKYLASVCDGAKNLDRRGFSKADESFGNFTASLPVELLKNEDYLYSLQLIYKYKKQLVGVVNWSSVPEMLTGNEVEEIQKRVGLRKERVKNILDAEGSFFKMFFVKTFGYKTIFDFFNSGLDGIKVEDSNFGARWKVGHQYKDSLIYLMDDSEWLVTPDALNLFKKADNNNASINLPPLNEIEGFLNESKTEKATYEVVSSYNTLLNSKIKKFSCRQFTGYGWSIALQTRKERDGFVNIIQDHNLFFDGQIDATFYSRELNNYLLLLELRAVKERRDADKEKAKKEAMKVKVLWDTNEPGVSKVVFPYYSADFLSALKSVVPHDLRSYDRDQCCWHLKCGHRLYESMIELDKNPRWDVPLDLLFYLEELKSSIDNMNGFDFGIDPDDPGINGELFAFQKIALSCGAQIPSILIADEMGLGKTVEALAIIKMRKAQDACVIVCPAIARLTWEREINKWLPECNPGILNSKCTNPQEVISNCDILIASYQGMVKHKDSIAKRDDLVIVFDESHYIKNPKAKRTEVAFDLARNIDHKILLTGTPLLNRPIELLPQLELIGAIDKYFDGSSNFINRYCDPKYTPYGTDVNGASNLDELNEKLTKYCMLRRRKIDVLPDLPSKQRTIIPVELSNRSKYDKCLTVFVKTVLDKALQKAKSLAKEMKVPKGSYSAFIDEQYISSVRKIGKAMAVMAINELRKISALGKISSSVEWIDNFIQSGEKLVVFAYHKDTQQKLYKQLELLNLNVDHLFSTDSDIQKRESIDKFQSGDTQVLVCSLHGANTNITLTAASNVYFHDLDWKPGTHLQAEDRVLRIGADESVKYANMWYGIAENTIDEKLWSMLNQKMKIIEEATDGITSTNEFLDIKDDMSDFLMDLLEREVDVTSS